MQYFSELHCLVGDLVDFLELSMFINASLPLNILFEMSIEDGDDKKKILKANKAVGLSLDI